MKKCLFFSFFWLTLFHTALCFAVKSVTTDLTPVVGWRQDSLKWNLRNGPSGQWKNLNFVDYGVKGKTIVRDVFVINYDITLANLVNGTFHDNRYLNPRQNSSLPAKKFSSLAFRPNLGLGYKIKVYRYFDFIPQVGFVYDLLHLKTKSENTGPFSAFKNTIQWYGPWFGFDTTTKISQRLTMNLSAAYQIAFYRGSGNWEIPLSQGQNRMNQHASGSGFGGRFRLQYEVVKSISLGGEADVGWKIAKNGNDTRNFANGPTVKSKLSKVRASSFGARAVLTKSF